MSCINRTVGNTPVEPGFAKVQGRPKWAIPWMEDDPGLTMPQLWAVVVSPLVQLRIVSSPTPEYSLCGNFRGSTNTIWSTRQGCARQGQVRDCNRIKRARQYAYV